MAWLSGWDKRKEITLTGGASGAQTDFQLSLSVTYDSDMLSNFDDLRFTQSDGTTLIDAWCEVKVDDTSATIWVEFPSTPANTVEQIYYMYYGKSDAASNWNGSATFIQYHGSASSNFLDSLIISPSSYVYEVRGRMTNDASIHWGINNHINPGNGDKSLILFGYDPYIYYQTKNNGVSTLISETVTLIQNQWYNGKIIYNGTTARGYLDGDEISTGITTNIPDENMGLFMDIRTGTAEQDWSFVHKYAANPPTYEFENIKSSIWYYNMLKRRN